MFWKVLFTIDTTPFSPIVKTDPLWEEMSWNRQLLILKLPDSTRWIRPPPVVTDDAMVIFLKEIPETVNDDSDPNVKNEYIRDSSAVTITSSELPKADISKLLDRQVPD